MRRLYPRAVAVGLALFVCVGLSFSPQLLTSAQAEVAADKLPTLTGRVVDDANVLTPDSKAALTAKLKDLEFQSSIQFVVATVPTLQGEEIEPYANALFRKWQLGQKNKNNGLLFLIAPKERKLRFEVGYGLEGILTDALTKLILRNAVGPKLKANDYPGGIMAGVDEATAVMSTDKSAWEKRPALAPRSQAAPVQMQGDPSDAGGGWIILVIIVVIVGLLIRYRRSIDWSSFFTGMVLNSLLRGGRSGGGSSSSGPDDSFSGGGGDSGGGGASDDY